MPSKIQKITFAEQCRILVTSDIHGNVDRLKRLLIKMKYQPNEDYLIINGDLIEKGSKNIETINFLKQLSQTTERVHILMGNCDYLIQEMLDEVDLLQYFRRRKDSLVNEWFRVLGIDLAQINYTPKEIKNILLTHFADEILWLASFPYLLESEDYLFVHAGVPQDTTEFSVLDVETLLSIRNFYNKGHVLNKTVVVGHYPTANYHITTQYNNSIIFDEKRKIISIDGGNALNDDGQLNGLIINKNGQQYTYDEVHVDDFNESIILADYTAPQEAIYNVVWPYSYVEPLETDGAFTWCQVFDLTEVDRVLLKTEYIDIEAESPCLLKYHSIAKLSVRKGEKVKVVDNRCADYTYIKKNGILGWIPKGVVKNETIY